MMDPDFMIAFVLGRISSSPVLEIIKTTVEAENLNCRHYILSGAYIVD